MDEPRRDDEHDEPADERPGSGLEASDRQPEESETAEPSRSGEGVVDSAHLADRDPTEEPFVVPPGPSGAEPIEERPEPEAQPAASTAPVVDSSAWVSSPDDAESGEAGHRPKIKAFTKEREDALTAAPATGVPPVTPTPEARPPAQGTPPTPPASRGGCGGFLGGVLLGGLLGTVLAVAIVLAILYGLNGTLNFNRAPAVLELESRTSTLQRQNDQIQNDLGTLTSRSERLEERTQRLEALPPQVEALSSETEQLRGETDEMREDVNQLGEQVDTVRTELGRVRELTETFDGFLLNLRDLLVETKPLPTASPSPTVQPTRTPEATRTPTRTPTASPSPEATPTPQATPSPTAPAAATPAARVVPSSGTAGTPFRLTVTGLEPNTEYAITISNPDAGFETVDLVASDAEGSVALEYRENFTRLLTPGTYRVTVRPSDEGTAAPVAETELVIRGEAGATPAPGLSLGVEPRQLRAGQPLTVTVTDTAPNRDLTVRLLTPGRNTAAADTRTAAPDGRLTVTYSSSVTSRWNPGEWTVVVTPAAGGAEVTETFQVNR